MAKEQISYGTPVFAWNGDRKQGFKGEYIRHDPGCKEYPHCTSVGRYANAEVREGIDEWAKKEAADRHAKPEEPVEEIESNEDDNDEQSIQCEQTEGAEAGGTSEGSGDADGEPVGAGETAPEGDQDDPSGGES
jgi:hypothetical protein